MSEYKKSKKDMKFSSIDAVETVYNVIDEASKGLDDKSRKIKDSPISEVIAGAIGAGVGGGVGFAGLYLGGKVVGLSASGITAGLAAAGKLVGGGMAAGIGVLALPAVLIGGVAIGGASYHRNKKLREAKQIAYKDAVAKQNAIIKALEDEKNIDKERMDYLNGINTLLQSAIRDLEYDLGHE